MTPTRSSVNSTPSGRITTEALKYYVPIFQAGERAEKRLLEHGPEMTYAERNHHQAMMKLKELAVSRIASLSDPLITKEINKIISTSHLRGQDDLFNILYFAGIDGMRRGLRKFDVEKMNSSSTNYLFQWITTYAKKELIILEAPFGIPPSRFQRYKKISAVRKRLTEQLGRYATNEEVLEEFSTGKADMKTYNGRVADRDKPSMANRNINMEIIEEQERFEKDMLSVNLLDPLDDYSGEARMSEAAEIPFAETAFGVFCATHNITTAARVAIMSELGVRYFTEGEQEALDNLTPDQYRRISNQWKNLIKDVNGPFYAFLAENRDAQFAQFDVVATMASIEAFDKPVNASLYSILFTTGKENPR